MAANHIVIIIVSLFICAALYGAYNDYIEYKTSITNMENIQLKSEITTLKFELEIYKRKECTNDTNF